MSRTVDLNTIASPLCYELEKMRTHGYDTYGVYAHVKFEGTLNGKREDIRLTQLISKDQLDWYAAHSPAVRTEVIDGELHLTYHSPHSCWEGQYNDEIRAELELEGYTDVKYKGNWVLFILTESCAWRALKRGHLHLKYVKPGA